MIEFRPITVKDRELITSYIIPGERRDSNLSIGNLCCWHFLTGSSYALVEDMLVVRFCFAGEQTVYTVPKMNDRTVDVIRRLEREAEGGKSSFCLYGVLPELKEVLEKNFPGDFEYLEGREHSDYLYSREDLAELKGKDYQSKRNHVNKFRKSHAYEYLPLTSALVPRCLEMYTRWCKAHKCNEDESLEQERTALTFALQHFHELELFGGVIQAEGEIVAFTYGSPVNYDTFDVLAEKADMDVDGAYNIINQEFARHLPERYVYLNREEDLGLEGLRKAKLSYRPRMLLEKGLAIKRTGHEAENR